MPHIPFPLCSPYVCLSYNAGTTPVLFLVCCYYISGVLTALSLSSNHVLLRLRSYNVNFEHVQSLGTSFQIHAPSTLLLCVSGAYQVHPIPTALSHLLETWQGHTRNMAQCDQSIRQSKSYF